MNCIWILIIISLILGIINAQFIFLGLVLMLIPIYYTYSLRKKIFCVKASSNKSKVKQFFEDISLKYVLPNAIQSKRLQITIVLFSIYTLGLTLYYDKSNNITSILFRFILALLIILFITNFNIKNKYHIYNQKK